MLNAIRTDLHLLVECLKYQMKCPASQKQALLTIVSICQQNSQNVEFLREFGGVTFIYNLSRASDYCEVKETALFTLSSLAEFNESCKQSLCREEMFCGLADCMEQEVSLTLKRVSVYMLCVLVSNNKQGQSLAKSSKCIDILLNLFRSTYPTAEGTNELLPLWTSVSSALCACVNNPQNEENQCACMCVLPLVKVWLQQLSTFRAELAQPICSFIGMTVANNSCVQEYFASVGGLLTLSDTLSSAVSKCTENPAACLIATVITRTLSVCITDNEALAPVLSELNLVPDLLLLLSTPSLGPRDQLAVVLTLGHCTDACEELQSQLLHGGGLPLMISLLTDANDEEVRKAATFVLQTCKKLAGSIACPSVEPDLQRHRQSAWEIQQRIQQLERRQRDDLEKGAENILAQPKNSREELWEDSVVRKATGQSQVYEVESRRKDIQPNYTQLNRGMKEMEKGQTDETNLNRGRSKDDPGNEIPDSATHTKLPRDGPACRPDIFKHPALMRTHQQAPFYSDDELSLCSELLDSEVERILITPTASKSSILRCVGCVSGVDEVNSRSVAGVLRSCKSLCDFHLVLQRAEDLLKRSLDIDGVSHTRGHDNTCDFGVRDVREGHTNRPNPRDSLRLINLTPLKRWDETQDKAQTWKTDMCPDSKTQGAMTEGRVHRDRKDYSEDELKYLSEGVRRFGLSWNTILWAYPFQQGRTNVDLAKKYRKLQQCLSLS
ncbi:telomere repeats-binding bouquet formation protein 1 isoform X1 [Tachysurus fulvidraco]|uniref:telomere repeats-binding bouquet formation protein 1 isoform X1 n=2 Tax=Tachysurus fulvidraco TaxID=1234273 RepID=UPI000F4D73A6|nr:telomere repeats-binding bouquet formation protein 1 isoform X1 [Tachysurus fulvidraco]XP_027013377.1 telomere repeats-binding bouquet formation protein 1 isoform X1 [Tachysurus fulvidraco]XP_027013379.1 telomere repeats-binding bouquet formation protein 1 isoform X1 [Tachysurus fulvidraco]XP_027013380.1 telomere repeats-binding bouquet formation protein 1 isoform X1 [Tachysurus fulvidraco]